MLILGLLLIIAAALVTVGAIYDAGETATVEILGQTITTTAAGVFVAGLATMLLFLLGVWAIYASLGRARRKRAERKAARREQRESVARLEEERAALREENERLARELHERQQRPGSADDPAPVTAGAGATGAAAGAAAAPDGTHDGDSHDRSGGRSMMDRITGRHPETDHGNDHGNDHGPEPLETQRMSTSADGRADDRVIDDRTGRTDLGVAAEPYDTGRHRDSG